ncbi:MAG: CopG family transcriptional regulator [Saprospiraceae bacterium]|nr:CopG family transcriptional regulator [Saprospiraceae bacterium]
MNKKLIFGILPPTEARQVVAFRLGKKEIETLEQKAKEHNISRSELIRALIRSLEKYKNKSI